MLRTNNYEYSSGRLVSISDALGTKSSYAYQNTGNSNLVTQVRDGNGSAYSYVYDSAGQVTQITNPVGASAKFAWDPVNGSVSVTNFNGVDALASVTGITDTSGLV